MLLMEYIESIEPFKVSHWLGLGYYLMVTWDLGIFSAIPFRVCQKLRNLLKLAHISRITGQSIKLSYDGKCDQDRRSNFSPQLNHSFFWHSLQMSTSSPISANDTSVWANLKQAISARSGFQHWVSQLSVSEQTALNLDARVQRYLRETLETLAY